MATASRGFREVDIRVCSATSGKDRFPPGVEIENSFDPLRSHAPLLHRNNLTALSHVHNLYFVAYGASVHVFTPSFPSQTLSMTAELVIPLKASAPGRQGYIDRRNPHGVNHLIVGDLGNEEVLLCACDDGDLVGYTVRSIVRRLEEIKLEEQNSIQAHTPEPLVPFHLHNVGLSAWGLAIHKTARMIAVSANPGGITVFAFALDKSEDKEDYDTTPGSFGEHARLPNNDRIPDRSQKNLIMELNGHFNNIPAISFCNLPCDTTGKYLLSADINGTVILWDVWNQKKLQEVTLYQSGNQLSMAGWAVMFIDPRCFRHAEPTQQLYGCKLPRTSSRQICIQADYFRVRDVARQCQSIPSRETVRIRNNDDNPWTNLTVSIPGGPPRRRRTASASGDYQNGRRVAAEDESGNEGEEETSSAEDEGNDDNDRDASEGHEAQTAHEMPAEILRLVTESNREETADQSIQQDDSGEEDNPSSAETEDDAQIETEPPTLTSPLPSLHNSPLPSLHNSPRQKAPHSSTITHRKPHPNPGSKDYPFLILHATQREIHLRLHGLPSLHTTYFSNPLQQSLPPAVSRLDRFDRLNLIAPIPELGLVVIGSPVGRVAVITLTRRGGRHGTCGMRMDWILPFRSQEYEGSKPDVPLVGLAVGPVQGFEGVEGGRRFRILMTYYDNSVLAYEVWREPEREARERGRDWGLAV